MKNSIEDFAKENVRRQVPGIQDKGFFRVWLEIIWREHQSEPPDPNDSEPPLTKKELFDLYSLSRPSFLSDMYYIDQENRMIYFYEIEDTHPLTKDKLRRMNLWIVDHGDDDDWIGRVIVTDRYGLNHRMVFAYEHSLGPEPFPENEIPFRYPKTYKPLDQQAPNPY